MAALAVAALLVGLIAAQALHLPAPVGGAASVLSQVDSPSDYGVDSGENAEPGVELVAGAAFSSTVRAPAPDRRPSLAWFGVAAPIRFFRVPAQHISVPALDLLSISRT
jgi:hypothetical protein